MAFPDFFLGLRDFVSYVIPGFIFLTAVFLLLKVPFISDLVNFNYEIPNYDPTLLIAIGFLLSYMVGQIIYPLRIYIVKFLRKLLGNPRSSLISEKKRGKNIRKVFFTPDFNNFFKESLIERLKEYWGELLVDRAKVDVSLLCSRFIRNKGDLNADYLNRIISLKNMYGNMIFPNFLLGIVLLIRGDYFIGASFLIASLIFLRNTYGAYIEEAKVIYRTFYMLTHDPKKIKPDGIKDKVVCDGDTKDKNRKKRSGKTLLEWIRSTMKIRDSKKPEE